MLKALKFLLKLGVALGFLGGLLAFGLFVYFAKDLPNPQEALRGKIVQSSKIYDRTGKVLLYEIAGEQKRTIIPPEKIPRSLKYATIVAEDDDFYHHIGIDFKAIIRAIWQNIKRGKAYQGGSTITQQFIKNSILTPERTLTRKIKEIILALELERRYTKDEILSFYLNQIPYGSNAYGIEAAAQTFFSKGASELTLSEAATLAALPRAPSYYSPFGSHLDKLKARRDWILGRLAQFGYISKKQAQEAQAQKLSFKPQRAKILAPHFVMYVRELLEKKYGREFLEQGGLQIKTTLNWELQKKAEKIVREYAEKNKSWYRASNMALVALDPKTGEILAMVGSKDFFDVEAEGQVNVVIRPRQPGSAFKPIVYAQAFKKGYTPQTILFDLETVFPGGPGKSYIPRNYDRRFRGPVTLRQALGQSLNIPSVKVLYLAGLRDVLKTAADLGITTLKDESRFGLALVLGGGEVTLLELTSAYGVFAQEGYRLPPVSILEIADPKGKVLEAYQSQKHLVLEPNIARLITDILSDNEARAPMFGAKNKLLVPGYEVAAKTGTTDKYRDGWTIGYTPNLVVGVWAGNNRNEVMYKGAGINVAAPAWQAFMKEVLPELPKESFTKPSLKKAQKPILNGQYIVEQKVKIDKISGKLATSFTPPELIIEKSFPQVHCILHYVDKDNPQGPEPLPQNRDPQYEKWEVPVKAWLKSQPGLYNQSPPAEYDDIHIPENKPQLKILSPKSGEIIEGNFLKIQIETEAKLGVKQADFFLDGKLLGTDNTFPYSLEVFLEQSGLHKLLVRVYDQALNQTSQTLSFYSVFSP